MPLQSCFKTPQNMNYCTINTNECNTHTDERCRTDLKSALYQMMHLHKNQLVSAGVWPTIVLFRHSAETFWRVWKLGWFNHWTLSQAVIICLYWHDDMMHWMPARLSVSGFQELCYRLDPLPGISACRF